MKSVRFDDVLPGCPPPRAVASAMLLAVALSPLALHAREASAIIGNVTMTIGASKLVALDGSSTPVEQGMQIRVGDRVETEANGHVSLRFVDGQLVKVRPLSRLAVENYEQTAIKFRLDEGVVRSVTGKWGEAARDRFRLNTPVAAIGIKGTDFIVKAGGDKTYATVVTGAVVMSPLTDACQSSLGVCRTGDEKLLSQDMKGQMLEISRLQTSPRLVPAVDLLGVGYRPTLDMAAKSEHGLVADAGRPDVSSEKTTLGEARLALAVVTSQSAIVAPSPPAAPPAVIKPPEVNQLVWMRSSFATQLEGDNFSKSYEQAVASGKQATVVSNGAYVLFQQVPASLSTALQTNETSANFRLASGAATLYVENREVKDRYEPVTITGGTLSLDFARSSFSTKLNMNNATLGGAAQFSLTGGVNSAQSLFSGPGANANTWVNGALSVDGKEAAYQFSKQFPAGIVTGVTLWGR